MAEPPPVDPAPGPDLAPSREAAAPARSTAAKAPAARGLLGTLGSLREQTGHVIGELYARAARTLLKRVEMIEDRSAERRFHRHGRPAASSPSVTPGGASRVESTPSTPSTPNESV